jgi:hypothetical protein
MIFEDHGMPHFEALKLLSESTAVQTKEFFKVS